MARSRNGALLISPSSGSSIPVFFDVSSSSFWATSADLSGVGVGVGDGFTSPAFPGPVFPAISAGGVALGDGLGDGLELAREIEAGLNGGITGYCSAGGNKPC